MKNIERIADDLFNKIRSRFEPISTGDETGKSTGDPAQARFFNFTYQSSDGTDHGELTISIVDGRTLKITFSKGIAVAFTPEQEQEWEQFLRGMRKFAKRNMISFDIRDISRSNLTRRDIDQAAAQQSSYKTKDAPISESIQWSGTTRTSIQDFGATRLIVRHSEAVNEDDPRSRSRKIDAIFVETDQGERFRMPHNRLSLGRAMAQHLAHGGKIYDEAGQHIQEMAEEMTNLAFFVRSTKHRQFEDVETTGMVTSAVERYHQLRSDLGRLGRTRNYQQFAENFMPEAAAEDGYDIDELKERFVKKMIDDRLTAALPYVYRAYQNRQVGETKFVDEFESWTENLEESELDTAELSELMSKPIKAGPDGLDARAAVSAVVNNEELMDLISQAAQTQGADADMREVIDSWLEDNYPEYTSLIPVQANAAPINQTTVNPAATKESMERLRRLAGLL